MYFCKSSPTIPFSSSHALYLTTVFTSQILLVLLFFNSLGPLSACCMYIGVGLSIKNASPVMGLIHKENWHFVLQQSSAVNQSAVQGETT